MSDWTTKYDETTLAAGDAALVLDTSDTTDQTYGTTKWVDMGPVYGSIYVADGSTAQTLTTAGTYYTITGFTTNGDSSRTTPDAANDKITCAEAGKYAVSFAISFQGDSGGSGEVYTIRVYNVTQASAYPQCRCQRKTSSADVGSANIVGLITVAANDEIVVQVACDANSKTFTPTQMNLALKR